MAEKGNASLGRLAALLALAVILVWEVVGRACLTAFFPEAQLPPSYLREVLSLLISLLGV